MRRCWIGGGGKVGRGRGRLGRALLGMGCSWRREAWFLFVLVYNDSAWERLRYWMPRAPEIESDRETKVYSWHIGVIENVV